LELESAPATWLDLRPALTDTIQTTHTLARPTATMALTILSAECLSAPAPGSTAGDIAIMDGPMPADSQDLAALQDAILRDVVLRDVVERLGTASQDAAQSHVEGFMAEASTVADHEAAVSH